MKIFVKIKPFAKKNEIISDKINLFGEREIEVKIAEVPVEGRANQSLVEFLANYLKISKKLIKISGGLKSRNKIIEIIEN